MESSSESLTMNMKPRLNMQVAAACWTLRQCGKQSCRSTPRDSELLSRKEKGPQRPVIGGLLGKKLGDNLGRGTHMVVWRKELVPLGWETAACSRLRAGQWELGVDPVPASQSSPSSPILL